MAGCGFDREACWEERKRSRATRARRAGSLVLSVVIGTIVASLVSIGSTAIDYAVARLEDSGRESQRAWTCAQLCGPAGVHSDGEGSNGWCVCGAVPVPEAWEGEITIELPDDEVAL